MTIVRQFLRFAAVGVSGTAVQYSILWGGVEVFSINAAVASAIGYLCGSVVNYLLNYFFTFESSKGHAEAAAKYFSVLGVGFCINTALMACLVSYLNWHYWVAQVLTTAIGLIWNFAGSRWWAFRQTPT